VVKTAGGGCGREEAHGVGAGKLDMFCGHSETLMGSFDTGVDVV
jgi:hypothetical protein